MPPTLLPRESDQFVQSSGMLHAVGSGRNQKDVLCILSLISFYLDNAAAACRNGYHQYTCLFDLLCHNESFCKTMARMAFEINLQGQKDLYVFFQLLLKWLFKRLDWIVDGLAPKHGLVKNKWQLLRFFFMLFAYLSTQSLIIPLFNACVLWLPYICSWVSERCSMCLFMEGLTLSAMY